MGGTRGRIYIKHADLFKVNTHTRTLQLILIRFSSRDQYDSLITYVHMLTDLCVCVCVCVCVRQYAADAKDKQWLAERHHMRATGGKMVRKVLKVP